MANKWKDMTEDQLIEEANTGIRGQGATIEMLRRISVAAQQNTVKNLTWTIAICTLLLLLATGLQTYWLAIVR